jgi:hypothetical protein
VVSDNKAQVKIKIKLLKDARDKAIADKDHKSLKSIRRKIHFMKRELHKAAIVAA